MRLNPDPEALLEALRDYRVDGLHVFLGYPEMEFTGVIDRQRFGGKRAQFIVVFDEPISQEEYETALGIHPGQASRIWAQARQWGLKTDRGIVRAVNGDGRLVWFQGPWNYFTVDPEASPPGTLVDWEEPRALIDPSLPGEIRVISGRLVGLERAVELRHEYVDVALVELFEPLPYWLMPQRGVAWPYYAERAGLHSKLAYFIPKHWHEELAARGKIGPAAPAQGEMLALDEPVEIETLLKNVGSVNWRLQGKYIPQLPLYFIVPFVWPPTSNQWGLRPMRQEQAEGLQLEVFEGADWLEGLE